jgi:N-acetylneuraminic acid mutarotase
MIIHKLHFSCIEEVDYTNLNPLLKNKKMRYLILIICFICLVINISMGQIAVQGQLKTTLVPQNNDPSHVLIRNDTGYIEKRDVRTIGLKGSLMISDLPNEFGYTRQGVFFNNMHVDLGMEEWSEISNNNAPFIPARYAVWTAQEMIIWGSYESFITPGGRKYNYQTNSWSDITALNAPSKRVGHTAIWTGTEMIVWGGYDNDPDNVLNSGAKYNPATDSWSPLSTINAPIGRNDHTAIWTGTEMIIWGGHNGDYVNTGSKYNPITDTWIPISTINAPIGRNDHTAIWTGTEMIIWGGHNGDYVNTGSKYNPITDTWIPISTINAPSERRRHAAIWTGTEMIVWGGLGSGASNTGGRFNPNTNTWIATSLINAPARGFGYTAIWTGTEMIIWGGGLGSNYFQTGGRYNPNTNTWIATSLLNAPNAREGHTAMWIGTEMIIWGGRLSSTYYNNGYIYDPSGYSQGETKSFFVHKKN